MNGLIAVQKLSALGYRFQVVGDALRYEWQGIGKPDASEVRPLLALVKKHKPEVLAYLSKPTMPERILTCADCGFHKYTGPNPRQGWGCCTFKGKGCYGLRTACEDLKH